MTSSIHPDRYDGLCQAEERMKFLTRFVTKFGRITFSSHDPVTNEIDRLMAMFPELLEEVTEVNLG